MLNSTLDNQFEKDEKAFMHGLPAKWLMTRFSALGDVVLSTGVLEYWHGKKGWRFVVLTRQEFACLFKGHPAVEEVISLKSNELDFPGNITAFRKLARVYNTYGLLDLHANLRSRLLALFWPGVVRRYPKLGLKRRLFLLSGKRCFEQDLLTCNVPQRYALALEKAPPPAEDLLPRIYISAAEDAKASQKLFEQGLPRQLSDALLNKPLVAVHPYATHTHKTWPLEKWREFLAGLNELGWPWFVIGQANESEKMNFEKEVLDRLAFEPLISQKTQGDSCTAKVGTWVDFSNQTSLRETCALLKQASALVTGDSGPMHLASAVGTKVLALFGPTTRHWGFFPAGQGDIVLEATTPGRPYSLHGQGKDCVFSSNCMATISAAKAIEALRKMI